MYLRLSPFMMITLDECQVRKLSQVDSNRLFNVNYAKLSSEANENNNKGEEEDENNDKNENNHFSTL